MIYVVLRNVQAVVFRTIEKIQFSALFGAHSDFVKSLHFYKHFSVSYDDLFLYPFISHLDDLIINKLRLFLLTSIKLCIVNPTYYKYVLFIIYIHRMYVRIWKVTSQ